MYIVITTLSAQHTYAEQYLMMQIMHLRYTHYPRGARAGSRDVSSSSQQMPREAVQALMDALQGPEAPTAAPSCRWPNSTLYFNLLRYS